MFVSGSGSLLDSKSTYDTITRITAFNAIDAALDYTVTAGLEKPLLSALLREQMLDGPMYWVDLK